VIETRLNGFLWSTFSLVAANLIVYAAFLLFVFFEHEGAFLYINWAFVPAQFGVHWAVRDAFRTEAGQLGEHLLKALEANALV
jgi:hypothetical protein